MLWALLLLGFRSLRGVEVSLNQAFEFGIAVEVTGESFPQKAAQKFSVFWIQRKLLGFLVVVGKGLG